MWLLLLIQGERLQFLEYQQNIRRKVAMSHILIKRKICDLSVVCLEFDSV